MTDSERQIIVTHISGLFAEYAAVFAIDGNFDEVLAQYSAVVELADALGVKPEPYKRFSEDELRRIRENNGLFVVTKMNMTITTTKNILSVLLTCCWNQTIEIVGKVDVAMIEQYEKERWT